MHCTAEHLQPRNLCQRPPPELPPTAVHHTYCTAARGDVTDVSHTALRSSLGAFHIITFMAQSSVMLKCTQVAMLDCAHVIARPRGMLCLAALAYTAGTVPQQVPKPSSMSPLKVIVSCNLGGQPGTNKMKRLPTDTPENLSGLQL